MSTGHVEMLRTLKSYCNPDPVTMEVPYDQVQAAMIKNFGSTVKDAAYYKVYQLVMTSGGKNSETWNDFFKWGGYLHRRISAADQTRDICYFGKISSSLS